MNPRFNFLLLYFLAQRASFSHVYFLLTTYSHVACSSPNGLTQPLRSQRLRVEPLYTARGT
jgi:hypothetical protein